MSPSARTSFSTLALSGLALLSTANLGSAQSGIAGWGSQIVDSRWNDEGFEVIAGGGRHTLARRNDGSVVAWGDNFERQCNVPALPAGLTYVGIAAGDDYSLARRSDGSVVAWGDNTYSQCNVPALPAGLAYVQVDAGSSHSLARRSDGSVVAWGNNGDHQCDVPALPAGLTYVEVAAGVWHSLARRSDGSVVGWGRNDVGQCNVPAPPAGSVYVEIAAAAQHSLARSSDPTPPVTLLCEPGSVGVIGCPCGNPPSGPGQGCDNSAATGGATIEAAGDSFVSADSLQFTATGEKPSALSLLLQGTAVNAAGVIYGQGVRCVAGALKRMFTRAASAGAVTLPNFGAGHATITTRSAALGAPISPGQSRWYLIYYRDPTVLGGCPATSTFNAGPTMRVDWVL